MIDHQTTEAVKGALDNPKYKYRTIRGISKETKIPSATVEEVLDFELENVVRSRYKNQFGEQLYTSRHKVRHGSFLSRLTAALANRAD